MERERDRESVCVCVCVCVCELYENIPASFICKKGKKEDLSSKTLKIVNAKRQAYIH